MVDRIDDEGDIAKALVARVLAGDKSAEQDMINRYHRGLLFMLRHRAKDKDLANDIAQETWKIIIDKVRNNELKDPAKLSAFISQTGKYQLLMSYRKNKNNIADQEVDTVQNPSNHPSPSSTQPQDILERHNTALVVRKLLQELGTSRDREIMTRFYLQEQSKQLICDDLNLNDTHFHRVLFRARQRFKQLWEAYTGEKE